MEDFIETDEPLNPYAKAFFGLWALVALLLIGFQLNGATYQATVDNWHLEAHTAQIILTKQVSFNSSRRSIFFDQMNQPDAR